MQGYPQHFYGFKSDVQRGLLKCYFDDFFVYAVKDPLISEVARQLMAVGGVC